MLYYNDENLMFASLASNRRQTVFMICYLKRHVVATPDVLGALQQ